jgi:hypothetical protein
MLTATRDKVRVHPASPVTIVAVLRWSTEARHRPCLSGACRALCKPPAFVQNLLTIRSAFPSFVSVLVETVTSVLARASHPNARLAHFIE